MLFWQAMRRVAGGADSFDRRLLRQIYPRFARVGYSLNFESDNAETANRAYRQPFADQNLACFASRPCAAMFHAHRDKDENNADRKGEQILSPVGRPLY